MKFLSLIVLLVPFVMGTEMFKGDPEVHMDAAQMAAYWEYPAETHNITTKDGYKLTIYRIPNGRGLAHNVDTPRPVVFLQHGLDGSAIDFVSNLPNQAAAYVLADAGFDVWLGNFRGNKYARDHENITPKNHSFWEFTWNEMAEHDLPAMIDYALATSNAESLYYVGFSIGTTTAFAKLSQDQEFAKKIKKFYAMGPIAIEKHVKGPMRWFAPFSNMFDKIAHLFGMDEFQPPQWFMDMASKYFCTNVVTQLLCKNVLFMIGGPDSDQLNSTRLPVYLAHSPSGTSTRTMVHIGQMINSGKFQSYDYGDKKKNLEHYQQKTPPEFDLSDIKTPISIFAGGKDWLAAPTDVQYLVSKLRAVDGYTVLPDFNHFDFIWGLRAAPQVYWPIRLDIQSNFKSTQAKTQSPQKPTQAPPAISTVIPEISTHQPILSTDEPQVSTVIHEASTQKPIVSTIQPIVSTVGPILDTTRKPIPTTL